MVLLYTTNSLSIEMTECECNYQVDSIDSEQHQRNNITSSAMEWSGSNADEQNTQTNNPADIFWTPIFHWHFSLTSTFVQIYMH